MALPSGYTPLEYIESTGSQYVDTRFKPNQNTRVVMGFQLTKESSNYRAIMGVRDTTSDTAPNQFVFWNYPSEVFRTDFFGTNKTISGLTRLSRMTLDKNKNVTTIGGQTITNTAASGQCTQNLYLFCVNEAGTAKYFAEAKGWPTKVYNNGALVRNFLPCINFSGDVGLYDDVNGIFYGDVAGVGFVAGPVAIYTELEYIESDGRQCVDTGLVVNKTDSYEYILDALLTNGMFGGANGYLQFEGSISGGKRVNIRVSYDGSTHVTTVYVDGVVSSTTDWTSSYSGENVKIGILRMGNAGNVWYTSAPQIGKVYSCQIKKNGSLVRDYIPVQRLDGTVGLLDQVNNVFYPDAAGGNFIPGPLAAKPEAPASLELIGTTRNAAVLSWPGAPVGQSYRLYRDGVVVYEGSALCYTDVGLASGSAHVYSVHTLSGSTESDGVTAEATTTEGIVLITDRTAADVSAGRRKGYYNALDLIRVGEAMLYAQGLLTQSGYGVSIAPKLDWQLSDIPTHAQMKRYLSDIRVLRSAMDLLSSTPQAPGSASGLTWSKANDIEKIIESIEYTVEHVFAGLFRAGQFDSVAGDRRPFPTANSDMGRTWEGLDSMETTWANWELATWYLLLYGNLKEEGVVS